MYRLAAFSWGAKLLTALFNFASIVLLSQLLGEADRGVCALYALIIALILLLADMAGGATVVYLMQQFSRKALRNIYLQWAAAVALLAGGAAGCLAQLTVTETILLMAAGYCNAVFSFQGHVLLGMQKFGAFNMSGTGAAAGIALFSYLFIAIGFGKLGFLLAMLLVWTIAMAAQYFLVIKDAAIEGDSIQTTSKATLLQTMLKAGAVNQSVQLVGLINNRLPFFVLPATLLGSFSNSMALAEALLLLPGSVGQIFYSQHAGQIPDKSLYRKFFRLLLLLLLAMSGAAVVISLLPASVYGWLFGASFNSVGQLLVPLSIGMISYSIYVALSYWQSSNGKFYKNLWCILLALIVTICGAGYYWYFYNNISQIQMAICMAAGLASAGLFAVLLFGIAWKSTPATNGH